MAGELCIAGDGLAKCYVGNAGLTSEKFREDWISNGERVYRTGDLARWLPDGNIEYLGRTDSQVKIRGYRIELGEIESWLTGYEGIKNAVVLVKEKDENKYLAAYFISEKDIKPEMLRNYLAEHLPEYMLPAHYVRIDSMPLTSSGKIDRNAFPEIGLGTSDNYIAPVTREEQLLCEVWSRVLGVKRIGITDNFFSLGGDSIKSIQVCSRMRIAGYKVTVQEIFYNQTIDKLAVQLKGIEKVSDQTSVNGEVGLTGIQQKFFEGERLRKNHYNQSVMLNFQDRLTLDEVREIFGVIQDHHDALRMVYRGGEKQVVQYNRGPGQPVFVNYFDLQDNISPREKLYSISNELQSGIDLEQGPLLKLGLFDLIDGSRLLIVIHHLVTDGISWRILFEDIKTLYQQLKRGEILKLPPKTDSFKLWSQKLRSDYIGGKRYTSAVAYWTSILIQDGVDITSGNTVTENTIGEGANSGFRLEKSLTEKLLGEVHSTFNTQINDILLAGFLMSVNKHYGTGALQMDLEGHGREDIIPGMDMSRTIGWFTSVYPVVLKQTEDGLPGLIKSVKGNTSGGS
ncbi:condensation domain-containing protein [Mucilaginibacter sp. UC70_90]